MGGVDGLVHITDLSWGRISHPEEIVKLDQKINVVILDFDDDKKRIALGLKQLTPHPWDGLDANLKVGDKVKGKVVVMADYGAFVEVATGVEGLIHVSEMSWSQHLRSAQDFVKVGDEVEAIVLTLDRTERKMSLGIKQLSPDPWSFITTKYPKESKHSGTIRNFTNFGVFVELEEGVDGLDFEPGEIIAEKNLSPIEDIDSKTVPPEDSGSELEADGEILWVAGVRRGRAAPVTPDTRCILEVTLRSPLATPPSTE